jgi:hypothetical protein
MLGQYLEVGRLCFRLLGRPFIYFEAKYLLQVIERF